MTATFQGRKKTMTSFVDVRVGDYLYVRLPNQQKERRVLVTEISGDDIIAGEMYDRSIREYVQRIIDTSWITGIRLLSRKEAPTSTSLMLIYEIR